MSLPIFSLLPQLRQTLAQHPLVLLQAPAGAGKSTALPLELLTEDWLGGAGVLMLQPRRMAARAVAARLAYGLGQSVGERVGYRVRFESRVSAQTQLEVLTEGILTRRLQHDPELSGIGLVILDEFHERSLQADLALALLREVQEGLREDLRVLIMSATLDPQLPQRLGVPFLRSEGRTFPVEIRYAAQEPTGRLEEAVAARILASLQQDDGDILVFLAGVREIRQVMGLLAGASQYGLSASNLSRSAPSGVEVLPLYADLPLREQQRALTPEPQGKRRVILATNIAETSLTIEGIRVVIDSGQTRSQQFDAASGLSRLLTSRVTRASADQRAGRAGRTSAGVAYRLWPQSLHDLLPATQTPEILSADLAPLCLELAAWGVQPSALQWLDAPPPARLEAAQELLQSLEAIDEHGKITAHGKQLMRFPTHPRLAHLLAQAKEGRIDGAVAADLAALLEERDPLGGQAGADLTRRLEVWQQWRSGGGSDGATAGADTQVLSRLERLSGQWRRLLGVNAKTAADLTQTGAALALAYPERLALARDGGQGRFLLAGGQGASLPAADPLAQAEALAVAHVDMQGGMQGGAMRGGDIRGAEGRIFLAAPLAKSELAKHAHWQERVYWDGRIGAVVARQERCVGALVLEQKPLAQVAPELRARAVCAGIREEGWHLLHFSREAQQFCARVQSVRLWQGQPLLKQQGAAETASHTASPTNAYKDAPMWPDLSEAALYEGLEEWLGPFLHKVRSREDLARLDLLPALQSLLTWPLPQRLDDLAPTHLSVPSGSRVRLEYRADGSPPILAVKLQELFGLAHTPTVNAGQMPVLLHLLSPAGHPVQVTQDLRSFWDHSYFEVRKDLRGRYPKHPWPDDPWKHVPTRLTKKRLERPDKNRAL